MSGRVEAPPPMLLNNSDLQDIRSKNPEIFFGIVLWVWNGRGGKNISTTAALLGVHRSTLQGWVDREKPLALMRAEKAGPGRPRKAPVQRDRVAVPDAPKPRRASGSR